MVPRDGLRERERERDRVRTAVPRGGGSRPRCTFALLCAIFGALLLSAAPASAAGQRQHVFSFSFGSPGAGQGEFSHPSGIAVSSSTGDVYVADSDNNRLEEFEPVRVDGELTGEKFVKAVEVPFPGAVAVNNCPQGSASCDETEDPAGDIFVVGAKAKAKNGAPAKDPGEYLYVFGPNLEVVANHKSKTVLTGVAVSPTGTVLVYGEGDESPSQIEKFNAVEGVFAKKAKGTEGGASGPFAVESNGNFYTRVEAGTIEAAPGTTAAELLAELGKEEASVIAKLDGSTGHFLLNALDFEESTAVAVNPSDVVANGVDEEDDVYVTNLAVVAGEKVTTVAAFGPAKGSGDLAEGEGELLQRFSAPGLQEGAGIAVDSQTGAVYVSDGASDQVDVFELESPGKPSVGSVEARGTEPPPTASNATTLTAAISPAGSSTRYYFEYGSAACATSACQATPPATLDGEGFGDEQASVELLSLAAGVYHYRVVAENADGSIESSEHTFEVRGSLGLLPDGRAWEMVSPPNKDGAEPEAPTAEGGVIQASANGDAITYVADGPMPAEATPEGLRSPELTQILSTRSDEGGAQEWHSEDLNTPNATGAGFEPGAAPEYQFFSTSLALALVRPFPAESGPLASPPISPPLEVEGVPIEEEGKREQENTPYLRDDKQLSPEPSETEDFNKARENGTRMKPENPGYLPLVTKLNEPGPGFGEEANGKESGSVVGIVPDYATPDLGHVGLSSERAGKGLYEWSSNEKEEGTLHPVSVLPGSETLVPAPEAVFGSLGHTEGTSLDARHVISNDGELVFWSRTQAQSVRLYVRDTVLRQTLQLSAEGEGRAIFQTASADGSKVYFTDTQRLTPESSSTLESPNIYVAALSVVEGQLRSVVTDLTPQPDSGLVGGADTKVIAATEEEEGQSGAYVYFVADGTLAPGTTRGHCAQEGAGPLRTGTTCNLYVRHYDALTATWEPTRLVAVLSSEDQPDWNIGLTELEDLSSHASPSGRYLAFMSDRSLTGYDNEDASGQGRHDEEVYLYDAQQGTLRCASCNPSGARPTGVLDTHVSDGEGFGLVVDRAEVWSTEKGDGLDPWLAGNIPNPQHLDKPLALREPRDLSNDGRLFFDSADALLPVGTVANEKRTKIERTQHYGELEVGVENVYEYEPANDGSCHSEAGCIGLISSGKSEQESVFLEASESGNDAFFLTAEKLAPQDLDTNFDIYDAHVCESASPCPPAAGPTKEGCEGEGCQGTGPGTPALPAPASLSFSGSGNFIMPKQAVLPEKKVVPPAKLTRAQKLKKALKACKKDRKKSKRLACEKLARKRYGPVKKKSSSKAKK